jgi:cystathionine gamma-lyase
LQGYDYSRSGNPTRDSFEKQVAACENGKHGMAFGSGLAATTTILTLLKVSARRVALLAGPSSRPLLTRPAAPQSGDHVISVDDVYGGTQRLFRRVFNPCANLQFTFLDMNDEKELEKAFTERTRLVWLETPTNPTLKITDVRRVAEIAHRHKALLVVDNTFMSPALQNPLDLGADIVLHSVTKYIGGHSDVVMGVVVVNDDKLHADLRFLQNAVGAVPAPFDCYMAQRGMKTLKLRMEAQSRNAMAVAKMLESHPKVERVVYPGLPSHPQHAIAKRQMRDFGGMITFFLKGGLKESRAFLENLHLFVCAESLGCVESLAEHPAIMTHASVPPEKRKELGISDSLVRLSIGIEEIEDILADLAHALSKV